MRFRIFGLFILVAILEALSLGLQRQLGYFVPNLGLAVALAVSWRGYPLSVVLGLAGFSGFIRDGFDLHWTGMWGIGYVVGILTAFIFLRYLWRQRGFLTLFLNMVLATAILTFWRWFYLNIFFVSEDKLSILWAWPSPWSSILFGLCADFILALFFYRRISDFTFKNLHGPSNLSF